MTLSRQVTTSLSARYTPPPDIPLADWAEQNVDFSLAPNYETPRHVPFDADFAYYMREIMDWLTDYETREIWLVKCSRAGASEAVLCYLRWIVAEAPRPTFYLTADQLTSERFMESRIKRGMAVCPKAHSYYKTARVTEHDIRFQHMDFRVSWPNQRGAFKQDGWAAIIADEYDTWKSLYADMMRKRAGTYNQHKIIALSSLDPNRSGQDSDSPMMAQYEQSSMARWVMPDPKTGEPFEWSFGKQDSHGLRWPADAKDAETETWDLDRVRAEAYYVTPYGTRIDNADRIRVSKTGRWVHDNPAMVSRKGAKIVSPMVPFLDGDFGELAARFLDAKTRGIAALRAYFMENWSDCGELPNNDDTSSNELKGRELRGYGIGEKFQKRRAHIWQDGEAPNLQEGWQEALFLTVDVQKFHEWWLLRWWAWCSERVECGLHSFGTTAGLASMVGEDVIMKHQPHWGGVDVGYAGRGLETQQFCANWSMMALKGEDNQKLDINYSGRHNPDEGGRRVSGDATYDRIVWHTDVFRSMLLSAMRGETGFQWWVPMLPDRDYVKQVTSTHKVNGEWVTKRGHPNDHLFDCEVMQLVLARYHNLI